MVTFGVMLIGLELGSTASLLLAAVLIHPAARAAERHLAVQGIEQPA
jgi:hypothetical protein